MFILSFFFILIITLTIYIYLITSLKGVCFPSPKRSTDNEKIIAACNEISFFKWPSFMHSIKYNRSQLREYWTIAAKFITLFYKNKITDHVNINLSLISNIFSTVLIFLILNKLFSLDIAVIFTLFYVLSLWPYHVASYMGHLHLSQSLFLFSIFFLLLYIDENFYFYAIFSGSLIAISFFSSSASRKYPIIYFFLIIFIYRNDQFLSYNNISYFILSLFLISLLVGIFYKKIKKTSTFIHWPYLALFLIFILTFNINIENIYSLILYSFGSLIIFLHILLPIKELKNNLIRYNYWLNNSSWASHFNSYPNKKQIFGKEIPENFRGGGINWYHKLFLVFIPNIYIIYLISFLYIAYLFLYNYYFYQEINLVYLSILFISILPLLIHELTKGLKVGKALMTNLIFFIFLIAYSSNEFIKLYPDYILYFYIFFILLLILQSIHTFFYLLTDIIPSRMAPTILHNHLIKNNIKEFYTYNNSFNNSLVETMIYTYPNSFKVNYIEKLNEVKKGFIVIPSTSAKSVSVESEKYAIENGDFNKDKELNILISQKFKTVKILAKIKTMGASKFFVHESEVTTYRHLILNQINYMDRYRGNAWIIEK